MRRLLARLRAAGAWRFRRARRRLFGGSRGRSNRQRRRPDDGKEGAPATTPGREPDSTLASRFSNSGGPEILLIAPHVSVVIPIFNAATELSRCLASLQQNTPRSVEVVLVDDGSTDPQVADEIEGFVRQRSGVRVIHNDANLGFTRSANLGLEATTGDVVLLNSDTQVPPRWLQNLRIAAYQDPTIGTVTPLSDNSGAFSAPLPHVANVLPDGFGVDDVGRLVSQSSHRVTPETPTGNGFCLFIKRAMIQAVGVFDARSFPRGYGEENDLCLRGSQAGWRHVVDDGTYVIHARQSSFGEEKAELAATGAQRLDELHPDYRSKVRAFLASEDMDRVRKRLTDAFKETARPIRPRALAVVHAAGGGTPATTRDLAVAMRDRWDVWILESDGASVRLLRLDDEGRWQIEREVELDSPVRFGQTSNQVYRAAVLDFLVGYGFELVHIRHLIKHPLRDLTEACEALQIPFLVSFHDYYLSCPTIHLIDDTDRFCHGRCSSTQGVCEPPMQWIAADAPHLKHAWVNVWRERVCASLRGAAGLISASEATRHIIVDNLPDLAQLPFHVIEHGRDLPRHSVAAPPDVEAPIRLLLPGHLIGRHKGSHLLHRLKEADIEQRLELHFLGQVPSDLSSLGIDHGRYEREEFTDRVRDIRPSFAVILSPSGETYCHTLTESWAAGLPVVATDEGALRERISRHGGGILVDADDMTTVVEKIVAASDPDSYRALLDEVERIDLQTTTQMAFDYDRIYREHLV